LWNNATQINSTQINISHLTDDGIDIDVFLALIEIGTTIIVQDKSQSLNFQTWQITALPTLISGASNYWLLPVALISSGGTGTTNFANNHNLVVALLLQGADGPTGPIGPTGPQGPAGANGAAGENTTNFLFNFLNFN
jgi:hypothetical protein